MSKWACPRNLPSLMIGAWLMITPSVAFAADGMKTGMLIAYLSLGLAGVVGILGWVWWSWDLKRNQNSVAGSAPLIPVRAPEALVERTPTPRMKTGEFRVEPSPTPQLQVVLRSVQAEPERECPKCSRTFPHGIVVCPIDATPLEPMRRRTRPVVQNESDHPFCNSCGRVYEAGARFCYHDGQELIRAPAHGAVSFHVCKSCGWETDVPTENCPHDGEALTTVDPHERETVVPTIPMMSCQKCGHVAGPAETRCPHDGQMLYPLLNVRLSALPPAGIGPRRKVCTTCGKTFSRAGNYCAHDGEKLTPLN